MVTAGRISAICCGGEDVGGAKFRWLRGREGEHLVVDEAGEFSGLGAGSSSSRRSAIKGPYGISLEDVEAVLETDFLRRHGNQREFSIFWG
ncbi:hypothetical protein V6N11_064762 [Hibiscus sabdariffa]|uniref:Uncharacterized protein n=1 Tax=Hibiscus sabdariffa TaxID=183260 RepID=A0ABR2SHY0_9ROSI